MQIRRVLVQVGVMVSVGMVTSSLAQQATEFGIPISKSGHTDLRSGANCDLRGYVDRTPEAYTRWVTFYLCDLKARSINNSPSAHDAPGNGCNMPTDFPTTIQQVQALCDGNEALRRAKEEISNKRVPVPHTDALYDHAWRPTFAEVFESKLRELKSERCFVRSSIPIAIGKRPQDTKFCGAITSDEWVARARAWMHLYGGDNSRSSFYELSLLMGIPSSDGMTSGLTTPEAMDAISLTDNPAQWKGELDKGSVTDIVRSDGSTLRVYTDRDGIHHAISERDVQLLGITAQASHNEAVKQAVDAKDVITTRVCRTGHGSWNPACGPGL